MLVLGACIAVQAPAHAQSRQQSDVHDFDIPPGDLASALRAFGRQSGSDVLFREADAVAAKSRGVRGRLKESVALALLLQGSGFSAKRDPSGAFAIVHTGPAPENVGSASDTYDRLYDFNIPAGRLSEVIRSLGDQAHTAITTGDATLPDVPSPGVTGRLTFLAALDRVLAGTGLAVVETNNERTRLSSVAGDIVVTAIRDTFTSTATSLATRTRTPLRHVPNTVDTVTGELLRSQNDYSFTDALRNVPGVAVLPGNPNQIIVRGGFSQDTFTGGLRDGNALGASPPIIGIESIEVFKGPSALLTGTTVSGGVVNLNPKRAGGTHVAQIDLGVASFGETVADFDVGDKFGSTNLGWRVVGQVQHAQHSYAGYNDPHQYVINPKLGLRSANTSIDLDLSFSDTRQTFANRATFPVDSVTGLTDLTRVVAYNTGDPEEGLSDQRTRVYGALEQKLVTGKALEVTLRARGNVQWEKTSYLFTSPFQAISPTQYYLIGTSGTTKGSSQSAYVDLYAVFDTGPLKHQVIVAGDLSINKTRSNFNGSYPYADFPIDLATFGQPSSLFVPAPNEGLPRFTNVQKNYGAILQDQIDWGKLHAQISLRQSWYRASSINPVFDYAAAASFYPAATLTGTFVPDTRFFHYEAQPATVDKALSPSGGLVFDVLKQVSIYGSYSSAYTPVSPFIRSVDGQVLPPTIRNQYEVGAKAGLFGDRLNLTASFYKFTTSNSSLPDPLNPGFYMAAPGVEGTGIELSATGAITPSLRVVGGYAHSKARQLPDASGVSQPAPGVPSDVANLWIVKEITTGPLAGLSLGGGGQYYSAPIVQDPSGVYARFIKAYLSVDTVLGYRIGKMKLNLTVNNLLDRENFLVPSSTSQIDYGPGHTFRLVLQTKF